VAKQTGRSEVTSLNGAVADAGQRLGVPTPINAALTEMVMRAAQTGAPHDSLAARRTLEALL